ncbi:alpha-amylase family glycosyl hydrolase [Agrococcus sp. TF02-05]|uniref:alpha-amylase family glycosyl hydrolase n=1 Tax=Agrococcus sp. TF02-05 TaxID=2815211 RepID=UPI001AA1A1F8|nr:alpha-amylase family glycosyl hydrolase [Agrococcus sp. TF02-05]MBO1769638.1 alpha-amylase [Agrococcus sp. TF02-05]
MRRLAALVATAAVLAVAGCASAPPERRDAGVAMFQWTWDAIAAECPALGDAGVAWVLTSPPQEHVDGATAALPDADGTAGPAGPDGTEWWWSYQPVSYAVESRLGTRDEFAAMTAACGEAGVDVYADAVINHMAGVESGSGWAGTAFEHYEYPGLYGRADFHDCNRTPDDDIDAYREPFVIQHCELENLADLATESESVRATIVGYLEDLLSLGVTGFRVDAAKHIDPDDVAAIVGALPEGTPVISEVIRGAGEPVLPEQYTGFSTVWEFGWAERVGAFVRGGQARALADLSPAGYGLLEEGQRTFVANHDTERNSQTLSYRDGGAFAAATAVMLASDYGPPTLYSGYAFTDRDAGPVLEADGSVADASCAADARPDPEGGWQDGDWVCQHRWPGTLELVSWRSRVVDAPVTEQSSIDSVFVSLRGETAAFAVQLDDSPASVEVPVGLPDGDYCDVVVPDCASVVEVAGGVAALELDPWQAVALDRSARP